MNAACDIAVIGAGPAGLAAATVAAEQGATVVVFDEQPAPGGQIYRSIERAQQSPELRRILGPDYAHGAGLVERFRNSGAGYAPGASVWQITPEREVWATQAGRSAVTQAGCVILATGAMERPVPIPGWTLPGVMTAGALQILLKSSGLVANEGLVLAGCGPLLYLLAWQLVQAGQPPSAILDTAAKADELRALRYLPRVLHRPPGVLQAEGLSYLRKGLSLRRALSSAKLKVFGRVTDIRIEGDASVAGISFRAGDAIYRIPAQLVALHEGVIPAQQTTRSLGCAHEWDSTQHCFRPVLDRWGNTSVPGILVAGDAGGIGGARAAEHSGRIAAWEALRHLGRIDEVTRIRSAAADVAGKAVHLAIRPFLDALYPPRTEILRPADDVIVCRCEEIRAGQVRDVARRGCQGPNQAKSFLRAGMGPCQGRMCGNTVSELIAAEREVGVNDVGYFRIRPPLKPVTLGELAAMEVTAMEVAH
jgi:NADPH-dependent 2,4-dienoyl-CoA reductase/sulfur reductase-like enzyme